MQLPLTFLIRARVTSTGLDHYVVDHRSGRVLDGPFDNFDAAIRCAREAGECGQLRLWYERVTADGRIMLMAALNSSRPVPPRH